MSLDPPGGCPRCGRDRVPGPECPHCGVLYAKARPRAARPPPDTGIGAGDWAAAGAERLLSPPVIWLGDVDAARRELLIRAAAPPAALLVAWALVSSDAGHAFVRTFLSMWVHELGHAVTAWLTGHGAFPGPWQTFVSESRQPMVVACLAVALAALAWRGWRSGRPALAALGAAGLVVQLTCTLLPPGAAGALITFGGDGGAMVLGAALVSTLWTDPEGPLGRGSLRWGFLGIGAAALVDTLDTWVRAWRDHGEIPLGEIEGVGLSDASKLMERHGWSASALVGRYLVLGVACLAALTVAYAVALLRARARVMAAEEAASAHPAAEGAGAG